MLKIHVELNLLEPTNAHIVLKYISPSLLLADSTV